MRVPWEYETEIIEYTKLADYLQTKGEEGWELVNSFLWDAEQGDAIVTILKRRTWK